MAAPVIPPPPPGFQLDAVPPPPPGFTLDAPGAPARPPSDGLDESVPTEGPPTNYGTPAEEPSLWDRVKTAQTGDPVIDMWLSSLGTAAKGAPEVAADLVGNTGVQAVAGVTAPFVGENAGDSANFVRDFTAENSMQPQGDSARELTGALGEAFEPLGNIKQKLGDVAMDATGSPLAATAADMLPDLAATFFGGPKAVRGAEEALARPGKVAPPPNAKIDQLRSADVRFRPSDVRAVTPNKKVKIPGETRERFADGPDLKKDLTLHNQQRFTDLAAEELGVKSLDEAALAKAEAPAADTYNMVENVLRERDMSPEFVKTFQEGLDSIKLELPRGKPNTVTGVLGAIRRRAAKRLQSDNPEMEAKGYADRNMADAIEEGLGNELKAAGEAQLFDQYQGARQQFAKVNDVRTATRANHVDANVLYKLKKKGAPLSGRLELIADASEFAPNITKHSQSTAAREGAEVPSTMTGAATDFTKRLIRKIPGMDVGSEGFQRALGVPDEARAASYGRPSDIAPPRDPEQGGLDLREALDLEAPPGEVGVALPSFMRKPAPTQQPDMLGSEFEFAAPEGEVGVPPPAQMSLQDLLGLGEPLTMKQPPGRVGKPKRKP